MRATLTALAITALGTTACSEAAPSTAPGDDAKLGIYALDNVNGKAIPAELYHGPYFDETIPHFFNQYILKITGGELVLEAGGRFHMALDLSVDADGERATGTSPADGDYEINGSELTLFPDGQPGSKTVQVKNGVIAVVFDLAVGPTSFVFRQVK